MTTHLGVSESHAQEKKKKGEGKLHRRPLDVEEMTLASPSPTPTFRPEVGGGGKGGRKKGESFQARLFGPARQSPWGEKREKKRKNDPVMAPSDLRPGSVPVIAKIYAKGGKVTKVIKTSFIHDILPSAGEKQISRGEKE